MTMKTDREIAVARHMAAAHDACYQHTPFRRAVLYGMKTALGLNKFELPKQRESWVMLVKTICEQCDYIDYHDFRHRIPRAREPKTALDWGLLREIATRVAEWYDMPPLHKAVLSGMRIACAWVLELPAGGRVLEQLYQGSETDAAIGLAPVATFDRGN
jgi:hypothetical protein